MTVMTEIKCWPPVERPADLFISRIGGASPEAKIAALRGESAQRPVFRVGAGTCGRGAGAERSLDALNAHLAQKKQAADVMEVGCIGLCSEEPLVDVQVPGKSRLFFRQVTADKIPALVEGVLAGNPPKDMVLGQLPAGENAENWAGIPRLDELPFFLNQTRLVLQNCGMANPLSIEEYIARGGYAGLIKALKGMTPEEVVTSVDLSGLRGRGGGGFPTGRKWRFARQTQADQKYLICNADEGDPGAFMDRALIEGDPYRLLEGMTIAAYAIGASKAYIYIRAEYPLAVKRLKESLAQAKMWGLLGENILDSGFSLEIKLKIGAGAFVCGEETALIASIEGQRGMPRPRPPFPAIKGAFGKPSTVNTVETFANVPGIILGGHEAFAALGTEKSKGTKIFALSGKVVRTGLVEVAMGRTIRDVVFEVGGGVGQVKQCKAVQIGGPSGGCVPMHKFDTLIDYESLKKVGAMMGSGGLVVMDEDTCMVDLARFFMDFLKKESCGKCIPCREGTRRMFETLDMLTRPRGREQGDDALVRFQAVTNLERLARVVQDTALCGLGTTAPNPVLSTLRWFRDEYEQHVYARKCPAHACTELQGFEINPDRCVGCGACLRQCPTGAIMGKIKSAHMIDADKCIGCGSCLSVCKFSAVFKTA
ncbi:MAG: 4Fe-4S binding protein [Planctomycetota bacterium]|jgi:NADH:ubiquinone oxidoreductase subunit F (NADH-binding)/NAD-dependent dihydropyrimidine dehydrogenase PreA subunit/(2Fe-2S) ferredoxin|nr:4Fe-4S binding protein [Planctomycetota bacterium]